MQERAVSFESTVDSERRALAQRWEQERAVALESTATMERAGPPESTAATERADFRESTVLLERNLNNPEKDDNNELSR